MLTILGYYLYYTVTDGGLELPKATATGIVGAYGGLVYLSAVLGGWIADRLLGMERTVVYGGVVGKGGAASFAGVSCSTAHFGSPRLPRCPAPGEPGPSRAGSVTRTGGRPKGCEWAPYSAYQ
jgi:POT family proton-dependent oligopeptide transporter